MPDLQENVARGAELLDGTRPGWEARVDLDELDISAANACLLGQLFGDYELGLDVLDLSYWNDDSPEHGFNAPDKGRGFLEDCRVLTGLWRDLIRTRLAE